jgi:hypothetical protein
MRNRRNLTTALIGLAMLATPITAFAKDHDGGRNDAQQSHNNAPVSRSYNMPRSEHAQERMNQEQVRESAPARSVAPQAATHNEFRDRRADRAENSARRDVREDRRDNRAFNAAPAPVVAAPRDWREDRRENRNDNRWNRNEARQERHDYDRHDYDRHDNDGRDYVRRDYDNGYRGRDYRNRGYYDRDDAWMMPRNYAGGSCAWARHLRNVYNQDRYSGHPAAAADLLPRLHRAERACGGTRYGYNRWHR